jgi:XTP/dITP diphosphohydrolase
MKNEDINFVTSNLSKVTVMRQLLAPYSLEVRQYNAALIEPQANSVQEVATSKAEQALKLVHGPVVVEDSGFYIDELSGFPGAYTRYVLETIGTEGLLRLARGLPSRTCRFVSVLIYMTPAGVRQVFSDSRGAGLLAHENDPTPCPEAWSDLWAIVIPDGWDKTLTALTADERQTLLRAWQAQSVYVQFANWISRQ